MYKTWFRIGMEAHRSNVEIRNAQRSDQMDLRDLLVRIVKDVDDISW